ncbi:MAG: 1-acyl-sn-glycerol-3-phosphate acyltransferase [Deferrisomatales bacterium]
MKRPPGEPQQDKRYADVDAFEGDAFATEWAAVRRDPQFLDAVIGYLERRRPVARLLPRGLKRLALSLRLARIQRVDALEAAVAGYVRQNIAQTVRGGLTVSGMENLETHRGHIFLATHSTILPDSAYLKEVLFDQHRPVYSIFGDNLGTGGTLPEKLFRLTRGIKLVRGGSEFARGKNALKVRLAAHDKLRRGCSVWCAQQEGRFKFRHECDSKVLGMLFGEYEPTEDNPNRLRDYVNDPGTSIRAVQTTYEIIPDAIAIARNIVERERDPNWKKPEGADLESMRREVEEYKGHVHIHISKAIKGEIYTLADLKRAIDDKNARHHTIYDTAQIADSYFNGDKLKRELIRQDTLEAFIANKRQTEGEHLNPFHEQLLACPEPYRERFLELYRSVLWSADRALATVGSKKGLYGMVRGLAGGVAGKVRQAVKHLVPKSRFLP